MSIIHTPSINLFIPLYRLVPIATWATIAFTQDILQHVNLENACQSYNLRIVASRGQASMVEQDVLGNNHGLVLIWKDPAVLSLQAGVKPWLNP